MFNLKKCDPNLKGELGEVIARFHLKYAFKPSDETVFEKMIKRRKIDKEKLKFLESNRWTIDLIKLDLNQDCLKNIIIYEVKLINYPQHPDYPKALKITSNEINVLKTAQKMGFDVKIIKILLFDNWRYDIRVHDFQSQRFIISDNGRYSKIPEVKG